MAIPAIIPVGGAIAAIFALLLAVKKNKEAGGDGPSAGGDAPGGGGTKPSSGKKSGGTSKAEEKFRRGPNGKGWVFGQGTPPADFDWASNNLFVSQDCELVAVGDRFWPETMLVAIEKETLDQALAVPTNTALGFVDYLLAQEGLEQPEEIGARIMTEASPWCWEMPTSAWPAGFSDFFDWLHARLTPYMDEWVHGIDFGGGG